MKTASQSTTLDPMLRQIQSSTGVKRIFTTFSKLANVQAATPSSAACERQTPEIISITGARQATRLAWQYLLSGSNDVFVLNGEAQLISLLSLLKLLRPFRAGKIVAVDLVLRKPVRVKQRVMAALRKRLWKQVDLFVHYFRNLCGFETYYGIHASNSDYLPFKSNLYDDALQMQDRISAEGDYVFSAGRSLRDYQTLIEAARLIDLPVGILCTSIDDWAQHGTFVDLDNLPDNVRLIPDDGKKQGWIEGLMGARLVVVPTLPQSLCASGIGTYLDAMALGKAVIITRGPGADDVLTEQQAEFVDAQDPKQLAERIEYLWNHRQERQALAQRGQEYAMQLGGEGELMQRILERVMHHFG